MMSGLLWPVLYVVVRGMSVVHSAYLVLPTAAYHAGRYCSAYRKLKLRMYGYQLLTAPLSKSDDTIRARGTVPVSRWYIDCNPLDHSLIGHAAVNTVSCIKRAGLFNLSNEYSGPPALQYSGGLSQKCRH